MRKAVSGKSAAKGLIPMDEWLVDHRDETPICPICGSVMRIGASLAKKRVTHFVHLRGANCPTTAKSGNAFQIFQHVERVGETEARQIRQYTLDHIESIYYRACEICPELTWNEFLPLLEVATQLRVWSFRNFDPRYVPYMLLCCAKSFPGKRGSKRPRRIFFVLEPGASGAEFWHLPSGEKQHIWCVTSSTRDVDDIEMKLEEIEPWYRKKARAALRLQ